MTETAGPAEPAAQRAYHALERMIVMLELAPGAIATEAVLIERVGLGRTPVREAVQRLAWEGLLEVRPRSGLAVAPLNAGDWVRVIDARRGLEAVIARDAARGIAGPVGEQLREAAATMGRSLAADDVGLYLEADKAVDEAMALAADNPFATRAAAALQTHSRRFWFRFRAQGGLTEAANGHMRLVQAILAGKPDEAAACSDGLMDVLREHAVTAASR